MNTRNYTILKYLKEVGEYVTSEQLSAICHVSTKTILKDIQSLNEDMKVTNNYIDVKPSYGLKLVINDIDAFSDFSASYRPFQDYFVFSVNEREDWVQKYLIEEDKWIKSEYICEILFISPSVLSQCLKTIRKSLAQYDLKLVQKPHYGMKVEGREFNKRLCLSAIYMTYIDQREDFPGKQFNEEELEVINTITSVLDHVLTRFEISMSEVSVQNFIIDIFVLLKRVKQGTLLKATEKMVIDISRWTESIVAVEIAKEIKKQLDIELGDQEIVSLSIHLASKRIIRHYDESIHRIIQNFDVMQIVDNMLNNIAEQWHIDFTQDRELCSMLTLHLIPLEVRSRYNVVLQNPLTIKIKQQNILAYQLAVSACNQLVDYHGNNLSDEEISYIALHIELALLRKQIKEKKNVLIMSGGGRGTSSILAYQIKELYNKYINEIKMVDYIGIKKYDFSHVDLLITSAPIKEELPISIIEVNYYLTEQDKKKIKNYLDDQEIFHMSLHLEENLILRNINISKKEDVIAYMIQHTIKQEDLIEKMIENDYIGNYELENMVTVLSCQANIPESKVIMAILEKPILWNKRKVQLIIMPIIGAHMNLQVLDLFKELSLLVQNALYIKKIIKKQNYKDILDIFADIESKNQ
ncbi:BglG family transcription antiterminator [Catenibacterium mitsuokai]|uniref:BglG family transcription antiterminator n=1 Tax=Catenibacterium mitsuokai TaxID=100886 RepID=UPI0022E92D0B|nr:BglG family transcription antiterminator [Catenibacterium mitsuokai]